MRLAELRARHGGVAQRDVDLLLADALGRSVAWIFAHGDAEVDEHLVDDAVRRRAAGEPLQYIRGRCDFYGREFLVDDRVLIPRPETEILVEEAIRRIPRGARVADAGTGSGCIAVTLALERPDLRVVGTDVSVAALAVAKRNRDRLGARVAFVACDLLDAFAASGAPHPAPLAPPSPRSRGEGQARSARVRGAIDFIVSNPPYIPAADIATLQIEVRDHEPRTALTPGPRGTEIIERLLASDLPAIIEIGYGQYDELRERVDGVVNDLAGIPRVVISSPHGRK